jgi:hypothetical protein
MTRFAFVGVASSHAKRAGAQEIGEAFDAIRLGNGGELHTQDVVEEARDVSSPLHSHFEWDDKKAGHEHRLNQARALIRSIRIIDDDGERSKPAYLSIRADDGVAYRALSDILSSANLRERLLIQAERDLKAWTQRYAELKEIVELVEPARRELRRRMKPRGGDEARP